MEADEVKEHPLSRYCWPGECNQARRATGDHRLILLYMTTYSFRRRSLSQVKVLQFVLRVDDTGLFFVRKTVPGLLWTSRLLARVRPFGRFEHGV